jgi:adenine-specific DNA-methyltransferase
VFSDEARDEALHLFVGKQKNLKRAVPLKKNFIVAYKNAPKRERVEISTSEDNGVRITKLPSLAYGFIVDSESGVLTLPKSVEDTMIVEHISKLPETLSSLGLKMSTGLIVDSKCEGMIFSEPREGTVPLIRQNAIRNGIIAFPSKIPGQYLAPVKSSLMQKNKNMIIIKRIPAKSDARFINSAIYLAAQMPKETYISTHNKVNFIDTQNKDAEMCPRLVFGLFALLNSTIYDRFLSIVSKSKQINAKEFKSLPLPPKNIIENIGVRLMSLRQTSVKACDQVVNPTLHIVER